MPDRFKHVPIFEQGGETVIGRVSFDVSKGASIPDRVEAHTGARDKGVGNPGFIRLVRM
jgi:hypothetical protein